MHYMNHEHSQKDKIVGLNGLGSPKVTQEGKPKGFAVLYKCRKIRGKEGFFPGKTCEPLVVRGTTSFYNNKITIFPVGEGVVWNVRM